MWCYLDFLHHHPLSFKTWQKKLDRTVTTQGGSASGLLIDLLGWEFKPSSRRCYIAGYRDRQQNRQIATTHFSGKRVWILPLYWLYIHTLLLTYLNPTPQLVPLLMALVKSSITCATHRPGFWARPPRARARFLLEVPTTRHGAETGKGSGGTRRTRTKSLFAQKSAFALSHPLVCQVNNARAKTHT